MLVNKAWIDKQPTGIVSLSKNNCKPLGGTGFSSVRWLEAIVSNL